MCIRANKNAEQRPLDLARHLLDVHSISVDAYVQMNLENPCHGFELGLIAERVE